MSEHQFFTEKEALQTAGEDSALYRNVGRGGLAVCKVCSCFEGSLASECPGEKVAFNQQDRIYRREIDFVGGQWVTLAASHPGGCPACKHTDCENRDNSDTSLCPSHSTLSETAESQGEANDR